MPDEVSLAVPIDVERPDLDASSDRLFENTGPNGLALDRDLAWEGNIDGQEFHGSTTIVPCFLVFPAQDRCLREPSSLVP